MRMQPTVTHIAYSHSSCAQTQQDHFLVKCQQLSCHLLAILVLVLLNPQFVKGCAPPHTPGAEDHAALQVCARQQQHTAISSTSKIC